MPVPQNARIPAATRCTGPVGMCRADASIRYGSYAGGMGCSESFNTRDGTSEYRSARSKPVRGNNCPVDRLHTIPIDTTQPARLPPWEIFQRGPSEQRAQPLHLGPHQKIFTFADIDLQPVHNRAASRNRTFAATARLKGVQRPLCGPIRPMQMQHWSRLRRGFRGVSDVDEVDHLIKARNVPPFGGKSELVIDGKSIGRVVSEMLWEQSVAAATINFGQHKRR